MLCNCIVHCKFSVWSTYCSCCSLITDVWLLSLLWKNKTNFSVSVPEKSGVFLCFFCHEIHGRCESTRLRENYRNVFRNMVIQILVNLLCLSKLSFQVQKSVIVRNDYLSSNRKLTQVLYYYKYNYLLLRI